MDDTSAPEVFHFNLFDISHRDIITSIFAIARIIQGQAYLRDLPGAEQLTHQHRLNVVAIEVAGSSDLTDFAQKLARMIASPIGAAERKKFQPRIVE